MPGLDADKLKISPHLDIQVNNRLLTQDELRLIQKVQVIHEKGKEDTAEIHFVDPYLDLTGKTEWMPIKLNSVVYIFCGWDFEIATKGPFKVKEIAFEFGPDGQPKYICKLTDKSLGRMSISPVSRTWRNVTTEEVVNLIAEKYGLEKDINILDYDNVTFDDERTLTQAGFDDATLLQRLAEELGYQWGVRNNILYFNRPDDFKNDVLIMEWRVGKKTLKRLTPKVKSFTLGKPKGAKCVANVNLSAAQTNVFNYAINTGREILNNFSGTSASVTPDSDIYRGVFTDTQGNSLTESQFLERIAQRAGEIERNTPGLTANPSSFNPQEALFGIGELGVNTAVEFITKTHSEIDPANYATTSGKLSDGGFGLFDIDFDSEDIAKKAKSAADSFAEGISTVLDNSNELGSSTTGGNKRKPRIPQEKSNVPQEFMRFENFTGLSEAVEFITPEVVKNALDADKNQAEPTQFINGGKGRATPDTEEKAKVAVAKKYRQKVVEATMEPTIPSWKWETEEVLYVVGVAEMCEGLYTVNKVTLTYDNNIGLNTILDCTKGRPGRKSKCAANENILCIDDQFIKSSGGNPRKPNDTFDRLRNVLDASTGKVERLKNRALETVKFGNFGNRE